MMCRPRPGARCSDKGKPAAWVAKQRGITVGAVESERSAVASSKSRSKPAPASAPEIVRSKVRELAAAQWHGYVRLAELRAALGDMSREQQDAAIIALSDSGQAMATADLSQRLLTEADVTAGLLIAGEVRHRICLREN